MLSTRISLLQVFSSPYVRVIQTATPFIEASGLPLKLEEGIAETRHSPGCVATPQERFAYFPTIDTSHKTMYEVTNTEGSEWYHKKTGEKRPCEVCAILVLSCPLNANMLFW